jgi:UDP-N-acetylglucosamine transferase subunit ALG13
MIFVTVGTEQFPFDRLLTWVAQAVTAGSVQEELLIQSGPSRIQVPHAIQQDFMSVHLFDYFLKQARLVISHCGEGSLLHLQASGKPFILMPRRHALGEHVDDHQWDMAHALEPSGIPMAWIPTDIQKFIKVPQPCQPLPLLETKLADYLIMTYEHQGLRP